MNFAQYQARNNEIAARVQQTLVDDNQLKDLLTEVKTPNLKDPAFFEFTSILMNRMVQDPEYLAVAAEATANKDTLIKEAAATLTAAAEADPTLISGIREVFGAPHIFAYLTELSHAEWYIDPFIQIVWGIENYTAKHS